MAINEAHQITMDNLDELEVHLTIVAKNPSSVKSTGAFLGRRDWPTKIISNANEAIEAITKDKPDIVLLSFNHPNLNVEKFATLLAQTFNMTCVGFCETEDRTAIAKLHASKLRYKLAGGASGPTIYRFIRKVLIEKYGLNVTEDGTPKTVKEGIVEKEDEDSGMIFTGNTGISYGKTSVVKGEQLESGPINVEDNKSGPFTGGIAIQEGQNKNKGSFSTGEGFDSFSGTATLEGNDSSSGGIVIGEGLDPLGKGNPERERHRSPVDGRIISTKSSKKDHSPIQEGEDEGYERDATKPHLKKKRLSAITKAKISAELRAHVKEDLNQKEATLHAATQELMQTMASSNPDLGSHPDDSIEWIGILPVVSKDFQGYFAIPVQTEPNAEAEQTLQKIKVSIIQDLQKKGFEPTIEDGFFIRIDPTYFSSLAKGRAQFTLQQGITDQSELCVSYFSSPEATPTAKRVNKTMSAIKVESVSTEEPIDFKVYLHLNKNKKYFLYLNNGRTLSEKQKDHLQEKVLVHFS